MTFRIKDNDDSLIPRRSETIHPHDCSVVFQRMGTFNAQRYTNRSSSPWDLAQRLLLVHLIT